MTRPATSAKHPGLRVEPFLGDFEPDLGAIPAGGPRIIAFLGSTVGNLEPVARGKFLALHSRAQYPPWPSASVLPRQAELTLRNQSSAWATHTLPPNRRLESGAGGLAGMGVSQAVALRGPAGLVPYTACRLVTAWL